MVMCQSSSPRRILIIYSTLMYSHRALKDRVDVVDLDPYGTAAPFIDAAVQSVRDDGTLPQCRG
jgi:tRNA G26 N,N-dimethylase Trm1